VLGRSVALAERLCATCANVSPEKAFALPVLWLQKYNVAAGIMLVAPHRGPAHWSADKTTTSCTLDFGRTANHEETATVDRELF
jgi:hypothetical protein